MCAASRSVRAFLAACSLAATVHAQPAVIPGASAPGSPPLTTDSVPQAAATAGNPPGSAEPAFTPAPVPEFTAAGADASAHPAVAPAKESPKPASPPLPPAPWAAPRDSTTLRPAESVRVDPADPRAADAHCDRVVFLPTADTHPAGTFYVSSYEIAILQAGYALSDRVQLSATLVPPVGKDFLLPLDLSLKAVVARGRQVRVAALASATGLLGFEQGESFFGRFGGVTQLCFDEKCRSSANVSANLILGGRALLVANGLGIIARTSDLVALLFEMQSLVPVGREVADAHGIAGAFGVRLGGPRWAVDLALEAPIQPTSKDVKVIPVLVGTYRFLP